MSDGKKAVVAEIAAELGGGTGLTAAAPEGAAVGDLFDALDLAAEAAGGAFQAPARRGRGRPAGTADRSTADLRRYLAAKGYRDPLEFLASIYSADPRQLAADLAGHGDAGRVGQDLTTEASRLMIRAAESALPYLHRKMPLDVHHTGEGEVPIFVIVDDTRRVAGKSGGDGFMSVVDDVQYQEVKTDAPATLADRSHGERPHEDEKR